MPYADAADPDRNRVVAHPRLLQVIKECAKSPLVVGMTTCDLAERLGRTAPNWRGDMARGWIRLRLDQVEPYLEAIRACEEDRARFRLALHLAHASQLVQEAFFDLSGTSELREPRDEEAVPSPQS